MEIKKGREKERGKYTAAVCQNGQMTSSVYQMTISFHGRGAKAFGGHQPGQFAQFDLSATALPRAGQAGTQLRDKLHRAVILRRPFSFSKIEKQGDTTYAELIYYVVGPGSYRMTTLKAAETISIIGPLGRGFWLPKNKTTAIIVCGGFGAGPLLHLARWLRGNHPNIGITVFAGARTADLLPFQTTVERQNIRASRGNWLKDFAELGLESTVTTDDGSAGHKGFVTDALKNRLEQNSDKADETVIYACGPEPMMAKVARLAEEHKTNCQVSMEKRMGCGIGVCQSCAIQCREPDSQKTSYKLCCEDGPVFDSREIVF